MPFMRRSVPLMLPNAYREKLPAILYAAISGEYSEVFDLFSTFRCSLMTMYTATSRTSTSLYAGSDSAFFTISGGK